MAHVARLGALWETAKSSVIPLTDLPVGTILRGTFNNAATDFILVQQGTPSALYDGFGGTTTLLFKDIIEARRFHYYSGAEFSTSEIHEYLNSVVLGLFSSGLKESIVQVKVPYRSGVSGSTIASGSNGAASYVWLLGGYEVNWNTSTNTSLPVDGVTFSYFVGTTTTDEKRIAKFQGNAFYWWTRSSNTTIGQTFTVSGIGAPFSYATSNPSVGVRPAFSLPNNLYVEGVPNPDGSYNLIV